MDDWEVKYKIKNILPSRKPNFKTPPCDYDLRAIRQTAATMAGKKWVHHRIIFSKNIQILFQITNDIKLLNVSS